MKKTLIAAGIAAVVAAPAFADVKISGVVEQAFVATENGDFVGSSDNSLAFAASEDLGNGLSAFAKIVLDTDGDTTKDEVVGLKGSFGTFVTGRMEDFTRSKLASKMTFVGAAGAGGDGATTVEGRMNRGAGRADGAIAYVTPTVNGLHAGVASYSDNSQDVAVFYDNGPLSLAVSHEMLDTGSASGTNDTTLMAASYSMGDLKGTIVRAKYEADGAADGVDMAYRIDYKMGNNTVSVAYLDNETAAGANDGSVTQAELVHKFSKQTAAYVSYVSVDEETATDTDSVTFGMYHKF